MSDGEPLTAEVFAGLDYSFLFFFKKRRNGSLSTLPPLWTMEIVVPLVSLSCPHVDRGDCCPVIVAESPTEGPARRELGQVVVAYSSTTLLQATSI